MEPPVTPDPFGQSTAAGHQCGAFVLADGHVFHHLVELFFIDARPHVRRGLQAVAYAKRLCAFDESIQEILVNFLVHGYAARGCASLTGSAEAAPDRAIYGQVQIGVFENDYNILASHFQMARPQLGRAGLAHQPAHFARSCEAHRGYPGMIHERCSHVRPAAIHNVDYAAG